MSRGGDSIHHDNQEPTSKPAVYLCKTPPKSIQEDTYQSAFAGYYDLHYISVLEETYILSELVDIIKDGPDQWEGVLMTSKRSAEAWISACSLVEDEAHTAEPSLEDDIQNQNEGSLHWKDLKVWTTGQSVNSVLSNPTINPNLILNHHIELYNCQPPKSASSILPLVLSTPPRDPVNTDSACHPPRTDQGERGMMFRPYLFLTGDKTLSDLPDGLHRAGRKVRQVQVYATTARDDVEQSIRSVFSDSGQGENQTWLAFFSPSSAEIAIPLLIRVGLALPRLLQAERGMMDGGMADEIKDVRVAVIGETTRRAVEGLGIRVHAIAKTPDAAGLEDAISAYTEMSASV